LPVAFCIRFVACWLLAAGPVFALDAKQIFESVAPSTVFIEDVDGFGSGVFINNKGLILTNYHVVAANIALKVRAKVRFGNRIVLTELDDVKVTHIHKDYDLALLQVQPPPNATFIPARVVPQAPPVSTGIKCYAIGNPGGPEGKALELSITEGLVSAAFRKVEGLEYTQISAQINPGNSGGPVCDELGQVIGIATWKMTDTEGIGFAIPMQRLNMKDFIDPKTRPQNLELAEKAESYARKYYNLAKLAQGRDRQMLLQMCSEAYKVSMEAAPNHPAPYNNLCLVNHEMGNDAVAQKYAEAALRVDPTYPNSCHMLGVMLVKGNESNPRLMTRSTELWFRGLESKWEAEDRARCADDLMTTALIQQKWGAAGYMLRWVETLVSQTPPPKQGAVAKLFDRLIGNSDEDKGAEKRQKIWNELKQKMPPAEVEALIAKKDGFTRAGFEALSAGKPMAAVLAAPAPATPVPGPR
jgi:hypothetical protein